jgi:hypothetical protein
VAPKAHAIAALVVASGLIWKVECHSVTYSPISAWLRLPSKVFEAANA